MINQGKLAVVMGIEVSKLFDCGVQDGQPECTADQVDARLKEVYDLGVRSMEIVNKFDNGFAGVAGDGGTTGVVVNNGNKVETGRYWQMGPCADPHNHDKEQLDRAERAGPRRSSAGNLARAAAARRDADLRPGAALQPDGPVRPRRAPGRADDGAQDDHRPRPPERAARASSCSTWSRSARYSGVDLQPQLEHARTRSRASCASAAS